MSDFFNSTNGAKDFAFPFFFTQTLHSGLAKVILDDVTVAVRQIAKFEREHIRFPNQRRSQASAQSKKQHPPAAKAAESLHGGVIDDADRFA